MRKLLKLFVVGAMILSLVGCGGNSGKDEPSINIGNESISKSEETNNNDIKMEEESEEKITESQEELNNKLKEEAIKADFITLNGDVEENQGVKVFAEGTISVVDYERVMDIFPSFTLTQEEGDGFGIYHITNLLSIEGLKDGDYVKIYGTVDGRSDLGLVKISAIVIEKQ